MSTQQEATLLRALAQQLHNAGIAFNHLANYYDGGTAGLTGEPLAAPAAAPTGAPPAPLASTAGAPPFPAAAPAAPPAGAPAPADAAPAAGGRKRRTKAEIAADDAAVAAGFTSHADMLAKQAAGGVPQAGVPPVPNVPGNVAPTVPAGVAPPAPPAPPAAPAPQPSAHDTLQAALMDFGAAVESVWPGQGHGNGQMGLIIQKMKVPNIQAVPAENVAGWTTWISDITAQFRADPAKLGSLLA